MYMHRVEHKLESSDGPKLSECWNALQTMHIHAYRAWLHKSEEYSKGKRTDIAVHGNHLTATRDRMPYGITQYYLPPGSDDFHTFTSPKLVLD